MNRKLELLIEDMLDTMYEANGVGLAAPQVGILKQVVVIDVSEEGDDNRKLACVLSVYIHYTLFCLSCQNA